MGYYTNFDIAVDTYKSEEENSYDLYERVANELNNISNYSFDSDLSLHSVKWYDWEKDMVQLSLLFPGVLFTVDGNGEDDDDIWRCYVYNGKTQHAVAKITYDDFDESELS